MKALLSAVALIAARNFLAAGIGCGGHVGALAYHVSGTTGKAALIAGV